MSTTALAGDAWADSLSARPSGRVRLDSVDLLRGLVMVIMALDHVRDFFTSARFDPADLSKTSVLLFFTRWITHFCAPTFLFLGGVGAFLGLSRGKSRAELARFLVSRGIWLIVLEFTLVRWAWTFSLSYEQFLFVQVIWALGVSMIVLAALVYLPVPAIAAVGIVMIAGHDLFDGVRPEALGHWGPLWIVLHIQAVITLPGGTSLLVGYPLIPWIGVMAVGFAFGTLLLRPPAERQRMLLGIGGGLTLLFVLLRAVNLYGDPAPWSPQRSPAFTLLSFLNTTKYPPSLLYLLMTLGPAIVALALFERVRGPVARFFIVFGRVPLFYYVLHIYLIHLLAVAVAVTMGFAPGQLVPAFLGQPQGWGFGLGVVYLIWAAVVVALYPLCRWFAAVKARRREAWLSYL